MRTENDLHNRTKDELAEMILAMQNIISKNDEAITKKDALISEKNKTIEYLHEQFRLMRHRYFGRKSEKDTGEAIQLSLFDEAVVPDNLSEIEEAEEEITIPEHKRKKKGRKQLPKDLPRKQHLYDLPEEDKRCSCGCELTHIGNEVSEQLEIIPMKMYIIEHIRKKYACKGCEETIKQATMPKQPIPKSIAGPGLLAHTLVSKFEDHLPLYRQEHILQRLGIDIPRATLANWVIKCSELLKPLIKLLLAHIHEYDVAYADESPMQVLKEPGRSAESKSFMWVFGGGPPDKFGLVYHYSPSRGHEVPLGLLEDFNGYLHCDGYKAYDALSNKKALKQVGCWYHVRRKFKDAQKVSPEKGAAATAIQFIKKLSHIEEKAKLDKLTAEQRYQLRQRQALPIIEKFKAWVDEQVQHTPPKTLIGQALLYTLGQWPKLITYLQDGRLEISNNRTERAIKPFAIGRKNWCVPLARNQPLRKEVMEAKAA